TIGGLWYNGSCNMMDVYGTDGEAMFNTWHIFGDASLQVRTDVPETMQISHISNIMMGMATFDVSTDTQNALVCLSYENQIIASDYTDATGNVTLVLNDLPNEPVDLTLTVTAYNKVTSVETVPLVPAEGAYLVVHESVVNACGDEIIEFGENAVLTVSIENVGSENASNVEITATTDDDYITLVDDSEYLGDISADEIIDLTDAFSFDVANNIPNEHSFSLILTMSENGRETWESVINMVAYAPIINFDNVLVANDENGILDAGETADLVVNLLNEGGASAENIQVTLNSNDEYITVNSGSSELDLLAANGSGTVNFTVTASEETPIGHVADFDLIITADNDYSTVANFSLTIGLCLEDFESGDFSNYPWEFLGMANWFISSAAYEGDFCAQSGDIDNSESSSISVELDVLTDGEISFWKKVSSENNYDYLRFFIDDAEQDAWSGEVAWSQATYPVTAGHHTFTWIYAKDGSVSSGSDCAWIDYIIFPAIGIPQPPQLSVNVSELNVVMDMNETEEESFTLTNVGGGTLTYSIGVTERDLTGSYVECSAENFVPGETTTWTFDVFNGSEDNEWITDVYITFPSGVTVNSSSDFVGGSGGDLVSDGTTGDGVTIHWIDANEGWGNIYPDETATAEVNVSISAGFAGNITLDYQIDGDQFGNDPHQINGTMTIISSGSPISWINVSPYSGSLAAGESDEIQVTFDSGELDYGTYLCNIIINDNREQTIIPVTLTIESVSSESTELPSFTALNGNYPNPFNPVTTISFGLNKNGFVNLEIYNTKGQHVRTLINKEMNAGYHQILWDGKDDNSRKVSSGIYFYKMKTTRFTSTKKMILMK
ncbi:MAG: hypothetical protein DRZ79_04150, partial [Candidatus Cloacimonadota bacterium]